MKSRKWAIAGRTSAGLASPTPQTWADQCSTRILLEKETCAKGRPSEQGKFNRDVLQAASRIALVMFASLRAALADKSKTCSHPRLRGSIPPYSNCCRGRFTSPGIEVLLLLHLRQEGRPPPAQDSPADGKSKLIPTPWVRETDAAAPGRGEKRNPNSETNPE